MDRTSIRELHYITDIKNVPSILRQGILSYRLVRQAALRHVSVADGSVQRRRARKLVPVGPRGRPLHAYANLYFHARNAMLYRLLRQREGDLTVLAVDPGVLDLEGVVVTDRNAAASARFWPAAEGIRQLDERAVYATWWNDSEDARQRRMAEVLVPDAVPPQLVRHAYSPDREAAMRLRDLLGELPLAIVVNSFLFFGGTG